MGLRACGLGQIVVIKAAGDDAGGYEIILHCMVAVLHCRNSADAGYVAIRSVFICDNPSSVDYILHFIVYDNGLPPAIVGRYEAKEIL